MHSISSISIGTDAAARQPLKRRRSSLVVGTVCSSYTWNAGRGQTREDVRVRQHVLVSGGWVGETFRKKLRYAIIFDRSTRRYEPCRMKSCWLSAS